MAIRTTIHMVNAPADIAKRHAGLVAEALAETIDDWHAKRLEKHFRAGAGRRYKYAQRSTRYLRRKVRVHGHRKPLVWSGALRRQMTGRIALKAYRGQPRAHGTMRAPAYLYQRRGTAPDKADELLRTTGGEQRTGARVADRALQRALDNLRVTRTETT